MKSSRAWGLLVFPCQSDRDQCTLLQSFSDAAWPLAQQRQSGICDENPPFPMATPRGGRVLVISSPRHAGTRILRHDTVLRTGGHNPIQLAHRISSRGLTGPRNSAGCIQLLTISKPFSTPAVRGLMTGFRCACSVSTPSKIQTIPQSTDLHGTTILYRSHLYGQTWSSPISRFSNLSPPAGLLGPVRKTLSLAIATT